MVNLVLKNITKQPCTKVTYSVKKDGPWQEEKNKIVFHVSMENPYEITVNEEYLILYFLGMICSIGGTFGLCIGFSFKDFFREFRSSIGRALVRPPQFGKGIKTKVAANGQALKTECLHLRKLKSMDWKM